VYVNFGTRLGGVVVWRFFVENLPLFTFPAWFFVEKSDNLTQILILFLASSMLFRRVLKFLIFSLSVFYFLNILNFKF
jgi:hypothetical protein